VTWTTDPPSSTVLTMAVFSKDVLGEAKHGASKLKKRRGNVCQRFMAMANQQKMSVTCQKLYVMNYF
jgi:hypothetical protein